MGSEFWIRLRGSVLGFGATVGWLVESVLRCWLDVELYADGAENFPPKSRTRRNQADLHYLFAGTDGFLLEDDPLP